jgi:phosphotransferase system HPr (HPr) family protein
MTRRPELQESSETVRVPQEPELSRRVAADAVRMADKFQSDILLNSGPLHIDGKSRLMAFILLDALKGRPVEVFARGSDSEQAVRGLSALFEPEQAA